MARDRGLDAIDAQRVAELLDTRAWQLISSRIERIQHAKIRELVRPSDAVTTATLRGYIEALETVLRVPSILIEEGNNGPTDSSTVEIV